jgi:hypothetical protein
MALCDPSTRARAFLAAHLSFMQSRCSYGLGVTSRRVPGLPRSHRLRSNSSYASGVGGSPLAASTACRSPTSWGGGGGPRSLNAALLPFLLLLPQFAATPLPCATTATGTGKSSAEPTLRLFALESSSVLLGGDMCWSSTPPVCASRFSVSDSRLLLAETKLRDGEKWHGERSKEKEVGWMGGWVGVVWWVEVWVRWGRRREGERGR